VPGIDQKQVEAMFETVLSKSPIPDEVKALRQRVSDLETQVLALAALGAIEAAAEPEPKQPKKSGKKGK
jgi:hypothetical protein